MTKSLITAAHHVNNAIHPAEASSVETAIASTELLLVMLRQHKAAAVSGNIGLTAIGHALRAATLSVEAREALVRAHGALNNDLKKVGLDEMYSKDQDLPGPSFAPFTEGRSGATLAVA